MTERQARQSHQRQPKADEKDHLFVHPKDSSYRRRLFYIFLALIFVGVCSFQYARPLGPIKSPQSLLDDSSPVVLDDAEAGSGTNPAGRGDLYLLGVGKADITGPVVEINLMGYADPNQVGTGLRQRLYSRAFIMGDVLNPADRVVYLVLDTQSGDTAVRYGIMEGLRALGPEYDVYGHDNIAVTGTHSHSGPGGWLNYLLPQITSKGFDKQGYRAIVDGAVLSIRRAHESLAPGYLTIGKTTVAGANINRSLFAYLANPEAERRKYNVSASAGEGGDDGSVEKEMTLLKFQRASDRKDVGILTWFPTHGTSMLGNNTLISGDNKGVAAYLFERSISQDQGEAYDDGYGFVAGFSQASVGDSSPNVLGAWCEDGSGQPCSFENSTCSNGRSQQCRARGPFFGRNDGGAASCFEIGRRQFRAARRIYDELNSRGSHNIDGDPTNRPHAVAVRGGWVKSFHTFHNMSGFRFLHPNGTGTEVRTCPAALGYSFAAGTSDGPGVFDFTQHDGGPSNTSPVWRAVSHLLKEPSDDQKACQAPKPILLDVGEVNRPYQWTPNIVDVQVFRVGQLVIIVSPGEATTMAGRRWKDAVAGAYAALFDGEDPRSRSRPRKPREAEKQSDLASPLRPVVVLGGPSNTYAHYVTTEEEYGIQRYEGASTLYGPHTLSAYINVTLSFLHYLSAGSSERPRHPGPAFPPDNRNKSLSFITGVVRDAPPILKSFGDVLTQPERVIRRRRTGGSRQELARARAVFVAANPRNNLRLEETYAAVEKLDFDMREVAKGGSGSNNQRSGKGTRGRRHEPRWRTVRDDSDWSLVFLWRRTSSILATSEAEVVWEVGQEVEGDLEGGGGPEPGVYRLRYYGDSKGWGGDVTPFEGISEPFTLV